MNRFYYNVDVYFPGNKVLKLGVESVGGVETREQVQALYGTLVYPTAEKILVVPVERRPPPAGTKGARLAALSDKTTRDAMDRVKKLRKDLDGLPDSVPPGRRQGGLFPGVQGTPADILALMAEDEAFLARQKQGDRTMGATASLASAELIAEREAPLADAPNMPSTMNPGLVEYDMGTGQPIVDDPDSPDLSEGAPAPVKKSRPTSQVRPDVKTDDPRTRADPHVGDTFRDEPTT